MVLHSDFAATGDPSRPLWELFSDAHQQYRGRTTAHPGHDRVTITHDADTNGVESSSILSRDRSSSCRIGVVYQMLCTK